MRFEKVRALVKRGMDETTAIALAIDAAFEVEEVVFRKPYTFIKASVVVNGVIFEGVGFSRQRQYTSLVVYCKGKWFGFFPRIAIVLARKNKWNPQVGEAVAGLRALENLIINVRRAYWRWKRGDLVLPERGGQDGGEDAEEQGEKELVGAA